MTWSPGKGAQLILMDMLLSRPSFKAVAPYNVILNIWQSASGGLKLNTMLQPCTWSGMGTTSQHDKARHDHDVMSCVLSTKVQSMPKLVCKLHWMLETMVKCYGRCKSHIQAGVLNMELLA